MAPLKLLFAVLALTILTSVNALYNEEEEEEGLEGLF